MIMVKGWYSEFRAAHADPHPPPFDLKNYKNTPQQATVCVARGTGLNYSRADMHENRVKMTA